MPEIITSPSNPKIKRLLALQQKSSARREAGLFVVEGRRELQHCIDAGFEIDSIFYCPSFLASGSGELPLKTSGCAGPLPLSSVPTPASELAASAQSPAGPSLLRSRGWLRFSEAVAASPKEFEVSEEVYAKIAMREGTEGVIA